jgi:hypothetical protein
MPQIPIPEFDTQALPSAGFSPQAVRPGVVDVSGLGHAAAQAYAALQASQQDQERRGNEIAARQAQQEAAVAATNAAGAAQLQAHQFLAGRAEAGTMAGATADLGTSFDQWEKDALAGAPQMAKSLISQHFAELKTQYQLKAQGAELAARHQGLVTDFGTGLADSERLVFADPSAATFNQALARHQALAAVLPLPEDERQKMATGAAQGLARQAANSRVVRDPDGVLAAFGILPGKWQPGDPLPDTSAAVDTVKNDPVYSHLAPADLETVLHRALSLSSARDARTRAAADQARKVAEGTVDGLQKFVLTGELMSPEYQQQAIAYTRAYPDLFPMVQDLIKQSVSASAFGATTLPQQETTLRTLDTQAATQGTNPGAVEIVNKARQIHQTQIEAFKENPWAAATRFQRMPPAQEMSFDNAAAVPQLVAQRVPMMAGVEMAAGHAVSPLQPGEADRFATTLGGMPPAQQADVLAQTGQLLSLPRAVALADQLDPKSKPLALALKLGIDQTTAGREVSALVLRGAQALADKTVKRDDKELSGWRAEIAGIVRGAIGEPRAEQDAIDAAFYVRAAMDQEGIAIPGYNLKASAANAVKLVLGEPLDRGGVKTILPRGMDADAFTAKLREFTPEQLSLIVPPSKVNSDEGAGAPSVPAPVVYIRGQERSLSQLSVALPSMGMKRDPRTKRYTPVSGGAFVTLDPAGQVPLQLDIR